MTRPEARFKSAVLALIWQGIYPGPVQLRRWLGRTDGSRSINGRETQWRREVLRSRGWTERPWGSVPSRGRFRWVKSGLELGGV